MSLGGYLGGYLGYSRGVGVNHALNESPPEDWTAVLDDDTLPAGGSRKVVAGDSGILLHRHGTEITAIGSMCTHAGGPLEGGEIDDAACTVTCPWHQSVFRLADGAVVHGPASVPQTAYETRVAGGKIEVRVAH
jgi:nitrite reductase/ring-hydroxylating ferredoxin subunit